jgi:triosephosphate isomerase
MTIFIKKTLAGLMDKAAGLKVPILYGGSVEGENAGALLATGISGFLVGHASAEADTFIEIIEAASK